MNNDITKQVWSYLQSQDTKIAKRVLAKLNYDICSFVYYGWDSGITIEAVSTLIPVPNYIYDYVKRNEGAIIKYARVTSA